MRLAIDETDSYHSSETGFRLISSRPKALGDWGSPDTPTGETTPPVVCRVVQTVVSYIVRRAILGAAYIVVSCIVCGAVSDVTLRSPSSAVLQAIRSAAGQAMTEVVCRTIRPAIMPVTSPVAGVVIPPAVCGTARPVVPRVATRVLPPVAGRPPRKSTPT
jgi:hypothetical protein